MSSISCSWTIRPWSSFRLSTLLLLLNFIMQARGQDMAAPIGPPLELKYRLEEEQASGTFVGDVVHDAHLDKLYDEPALSRLQFRFLKQQTSLSSSFVIDNATGVIRTQGRVDRETICAAAHVCELRLDVAIQPLQHFRIVRVAVTIIDINDNWPVFADREQIVEVLESTAVGTTLFVPDAVDSDSPELSVVAYKLVSDSDRFELTGSERRPDGVFDTKLVIARSLDREAVDRYTVQIVALDGGFPPRTGSVELTVYVLDANDNLPVFEKESYEVAIVENLPTHSTILQVRANDNDIGLNGALTYSFSVQTSTSASAQLFGINNSTGDIFTRSEIDYEDTTSHRLVVVVRDRGVDSVPVNVIVAVNVIDVNDNAPDITVSTLSSVIGSADVSEDSTVGTFVAHVTIIDRDSGDNGRFDCVLNDVHFQLMPSYETEYQIVTAARLDRERETTYNLTLVCRDYGADTSRSSIARINVQVTDVNDNDPVFVRSVYKAELIENNYIGAVIVQAAATDRDIGDNSALTYSLDGDSAHQFSIEPLTGIITAAVSFDREQAEVVRVIAVARDAGSPAVRSGTTQIILTVIDVNDERPAFSQPAYSFAVGENLETGTDVGVVAAQDLDSGNYGQVTYSIASSTQNLDAFHLNHVTGVILTSRPLDREQMDVYYMVVLATDRGVPPLSSSASVTIYVSDDNDNEPIFEYPPSRDLLNSSSSNKTSPGPAAAIYISNVAPVGHVITRLRAKDSDIGRNAKITFAAARDKGGEDVDSEIMTTMSVNQRSSSSAWNLFELDRDWGTVTVAGDLSTLNGQHFRLSFVAHDNGVAPKTSSPADLDLYINSSVVYPLRRGSGSAGGQHGYDLFYLGQIVSRNFLIIVAIAGGSTIVIVLLIVVIALKRRQARSRRATVSKACKYNCREEALRMIEKNKDLQDALFDRGQGGGDIGCNRTHERGRSTDPLKEVTLNDVGGYRTESNLTEDETYTMQNRLTSSPRIDFRSAPLNNSRLELQGGGPHLVTTSLSPVGSSSGECGRCVNGQQSPGVIAVHQNKEIEQVQRLLKALQQQRDLDEESLHSGEGSNADSGRGVSDEGGGDLLHRPPSESQNNLHVDNNRVPQKSPGNPSCMSHYVNHRAPAIACIGGSHTGSTGSGNINENSASMRAKSSASNSGHASSAFPLQQPKSLNTFGSTGFLHRSNLDVNRDVIVPPLQYDYAFIDARERDANYYGHNILNNKDARGSIDPVIATSSRSATLPFRTLPPPPPPSSAARGPQRGGAQVVNSTLDPSYGCGGGIGTLRPAGSTMSSGSPHTGRVSPGLNNGSGANLRCRADREIPENKAGRDNNDKGQCSTALVGPTRRMDRRASPSAVYGAVSGLQL